MAQGRGTQVLDVLDAAYAVDRSDDAWLSGVIEAARPMLDDGVGMMGWVFRAGPDGVIFYRTLDDFGCALGDLALQLYRADPEFAQRTYGGRPVITGSELLGRSYLERYSSMGGPLGSLGIHDQLSVLAREPDGWGVGIGAGLRSVQRLSPGRRALWQRIAGHLQAAHRLRRRLGVSSWDRLPLVGHTGSPERFVIRWSSEHGGKLDEPREARAPVQAVFEPSGRLLDAQGEARDGATREALRRAAIAVDRERASMIRGGDDDRALQGWKALVDGRWSMVDTFDSDGRRFLVARRNEPGTRPVPLLDERERAVLGYRAAGHSIKLIAYELGRSEAWVSRALKGAMGKLGLRSAAELAALMASVAAADNK